jgi:hypothetical protein
MRNKMTRNPPEVVLNRVLAGLEKELVEASDEEIEQAAQDLGMNLKMKGSAAFIGVKYSFPKRASDIFDLAELRRFYVEATQNVRRTRSYLPKPGRKDRDDDEK